MTQDYSKIIINQIRQYVSLTEWCNSWGNRMGISGNTNHGIPKGYDDDLDAFRHTFFNAVLVTFLNKEDVKELGDERLSGECQAKYGKKKAKKTGQYIWRTQGDKKVRTEHYLREGKVFDWDNPPEGGHPGEAYGCRCTAEEITDETPMERFIKNGS